MKNLWTGIRCGGFQFLLSLDLWGISCHTVVVFALGKNLLVIFVLGHCVMVGGRGQKSWRFADVLNEWVPKYKPWKVKKVLKNEIAACYGLFLINERQKSKTGCHALQYLAYHVIRLQSLSWLVLIQYFLISSGVLGRNFSPQLAGLPVHIKITEYYAFQNCNWVKQHGRSSLASLDSKAILV